MCVQRHPKFRRCHPSPSPLCQAYLKKAFGGILAASVATKQAIAKKTKVNLNVMLPVLKFPYPKYQNDENVVLVPSRG